MGSSAASSVNSDIYLQLRKLEERQNEHMSSTSFSISPTFSPSSSLTFNDYSSSTFNDYSSSTFNSTTLYTHSPTFSPTSSSTVNSTLPIPTSNSTYPSQPSYYGYSDDTTPNLSLIIGVSGGILAALVLAGTLFFTLWRRRRARNSELHPFDTTPTIRSETTSIQPLPPCLSKKTNLRHTSLEVDFPRTRSELEQSETPRPTEAMPDRSAEPLILPNLDTSSVSPSSSRASNSLHIPSPYHPAASSPVSTSTQSFVERELLLMRSRVTELEVMMRSSLAQRSDDAPPDYISSVPDHSS